jgi:hypothetical protein
MSIKNVAGEILHCKGVMRRIFGLILSDKRSNVAHYKQIFLPSFSKASAPSARTKSFRAEAAEIRRVNGQTYSIKMSSSRLRVKPLTSPSLLTDRVLHSVHEEARRRGEFGL